MSKSKQYDEMPQSGHGVEIVSSREKHGYFRQAVPTMPVALAVVLCVVNVILPGVGTLVSAFTVLCGCKHGCQTTREACVRNVLAGVLQIATIIIMVGWIWSIFWGVTFINEATKKPEEEGAQSDV